MHQLFVLLILFNSILVSASPEWQVKKQQDGITVQIRKLNDTNLKEYKAEGEITVPLDSLYNFLIDFENYKNWVWGCTVSKILKQDDDRFYVYYAFSIMPRIFKNRDAISEVQIRKNMNGSISVQVKACPYDLPKQDNTIRVTQYSENYELVPLGENKVLLKMQGWYNPGGAIPSWLINKMLSNGPYDTLMTLRKLLE